jgi:hypothetical protein
MKTTVDLPGEIVRELKLMALRRRQKLNITTTQCLAQAVECPRAKTVFPPPISSARVRIGKNGLPLIRCAPDAPAGRMGVDELLALEQRSLEEEDMKRARVTP